MVQQQGKQLLLLLAEVLAQHCVHLFHLANQLPHGFVPGGASGRERGGDEGNQLFKEALLILMLHTIRERDVAHFAVQCGIDHLRVGAR